MDTVIVSILIAVASVSATAFIFLLTHRSNWRNVITREFKIKLSLGKRNKNGNKYTSIMTVIDLTCEKNEDIKIIDMYFVIPEGAYGTDSKGFPSHGRHTINHAWNFNDNDQFNKHREINEPIRDPLLKQINEGTIKFLAVMIRTNKYGILKSNKVYFNNEGKRTLKLNWSKLSTKIIAALIAIATAAVIAFIKNKYSGTSEAQIVPIGVMA